MSRNNFNKITILIIASALITAILLIRLFDLQILSHSYYQQIATTSQYGYIELPAQRGEILIKDYHSKEEFPIATNTTLNLLYADPSLIKDPAFLTEKIAPLIFDIKEQRADEEERIQKLSRSLDPNLTEDQKEELLKPKTDAELKAEYEKEFTAQISTKKRPEILLADKLEKDQISKLQNLKISGIELKEDKLYAYPPQIIDTATTSETIAPIIQIPSKKLTKILKGENRYVVLKRKIDPEISEKIKKMVKDDKNKMFDGIGFQEEYFRFYPENSLGANIVGYVNHENTGQYGIESAFNSQLQGKNGKLQTKKDSVGRQITVGESTLEAAVNGDDIVLTIDRSIQLKVEKILESAVKEYRADSGQVIIMNPQTGAIVSMAHYPSFDPNNYGDVFKKIEVTFTPDELRRFQPTKTEGIYYFYVNEITLDRYLVFEEKDEEGNIHYYRYENFVGPEAYHNKIVSWPYEPGSVFKSIIMALAIDDGDITPNTTFNDSGPIGVDFNVFKQDYDFFIKNSTKKYYGLIDMNTVLAKSLNTGMTFIAKKIGPALLYSYLQKFGFLDRTDIEFDNEAIGKIEYFEDWTESELATHAFGQGLTITMIQLANAYSAIANGGVLMQPYIVEEVRHDNDRVSKTEPHEIRRVISEDTAAKMTQMLVYSTEKGVALKSQVAGHYVAGKTGTAQTYRHGEALSGAGTTIASYAGYGPIENPQFVVIVKFDHPRTIEWGDSTASPTFGKIAEFLFDYYNIPPDK